GASDAVSRGVAPAIHPATTFERLTNYSFATPYGYGRPDNPTFAPPEALVASLEGAAASLLFSSGMAAATAAFMALSPGDHVVAPRVMYWGLRAWLLGHAREWGLGLDLADMTNLAAVRAVLRPGVTKLVWIETPANPTWCVTDIAGVAA